MREKERPLQQQALGASFASDLEKELLWWGSIKFSWQHLQITESEEVTQGHFLNSHFLFIDFLLLSFWGGFLKTSDIASDGKISPCRHPQALPRQS